jgi:glutathione synthase/RimK-type ligase-like ATP-grasp enzyme
MNGAHWQIAKQEANGRHEEGAFATVRVEQAPAEVVKTALKAADLIGNGLYGVT